MSFTLNFPCPAWLHQETRGETFSRRRCLRGVLDYIFYHVHFVLLDIE